MSRFSALKNVRVDAEPESPAAETPAPAIPARAGKRGSSEYRQFSAYLRADLYRKLKVRVAERDMDLSDAINEAVEEWLRVHS